MKKLFLLSLCLLANISFANTCEWTSKVSRVWSTAANWSNGVPTSSDIALFTAKGTKVNPLLDVISASVSGFQFTDTSSTWVIDTTVSSTTNIVLGARGIVGIGTITFNTRITNSVDNVWSNSSGTMTFANVVQGSGKITKNGAGTIALSVANDFSGGLDLYAGQVTVGNNASFGTGTITVGGGSIVNAGSTIKTMANNLNVISNCVMGSTSASYGLVWNGTTTMGDSKPVIGRFSTAAPVTFAGVVTGNGFVASNATQTITITNNVNTFTGGVDVVSGTLAIGTNSCLGAGTVKLYGGVTLGSAGSFVPTVTNRVELYGGGDITLTASGQDQNYTGAILVKTNASIKAASGRTATITGTIDDAGLGWSLTNNSAGTVTLSTNNTLSGKFVQLAGTLNIGNPLALSTNTFEIRGGTIANTGTSMMLTNNQLWVSSFTYSSGSVLDLETNVVTLGTNITVTVSSGSGTLLVGGCIGDGGSAYGFTKAGSGILFLNGTNTYSGITGISAGTLTVLSFNNVASPLSSSSLGIPITVANGTIAGSGGIIRYLGTGETSDRMFSAISGTTTGLKQDGTGGPLILNGGCTTNIGTISLAGSNTTLNVFNFTGGAKISKSQYFGDVSWWELIGTNTAPGHSCTMNGGKLQLDGYWACTNFYMDPGSGITLFTGSGAMSNGYLNFGRNYEGVNPGPTNDAGILTVGSCKWYNDFNTLQKVLILDFGVGTNDLLNVLGNFWMEYAYLDATPGMAFRFYTAGTTNGFGTPGVYNLVKYGSVGALNPARSYLWNPLPNVNYLFGLTTASNGYLTCSIYTNIWDGGGADSYWSTAANWTGDMLPPTNGGLIFDGSNYPINTNDHPNGTYFDSFVFNAGCGPFTLNGNSIGIGGTINDASSNTITMNMPITLVTTGNMNLVTINSTGGGELVLNGNVNQTYPSTMLMFSGTKTTLAGSNTIDNLVLSSYGQLNLDNDFALGINGVLDLRTSVKLDNTFPSLVSLRGSMIWRYAFSFLGTSPLDILGTVSLQDSTICTITNNLTVRGIVSSTAKRYLKKTGPGSLRWTAANTCTGAIIVVQGSLFIDGSTPANFAITNGAGAFLGGSGTIYGSLAVTNGGTLSPGSSIGTLTVSNLTLEAGVTNIFELGPIAASDKIIVLNNLVLGGTIQLQPATGFTTGTYTLFTYGGTIVTNGVVTLDSSAMPSDKSYALVDNGAGKSIDLLVTKAPEYRLKVPSGRIRVANGKIQLSR